MSLQKNQINNFSIVFFLFVFFNLSISIVLRGQDNIGLPIIRNHFKKDYKAGTQSWDIQQNEKGILHFGNNEGLLTFDGTNWRVFPVENRTIVRSILLDDEKVYVGSQGDFGYFEPNDKGILTYYSLLSLIPKEYQNFADVWDIVKKGKFIYFRTTNRVFRYNEEDIKSIVSDGDYPYLGILNDKIYLQDMDLGLCIIEQGLKKKLPNTESLKNTTITSILSYHLDTIMIATLKNGVFLYDGETIQNWKHQHKETLINRRIHCATRIDEERYVFGTMSGGIFIFNKKGIILQDIHSKNGLQNNNVQSIFSDVSGNLWLGLENGIDYLETSSSFSIINPTKESISTGYSARIHNNKIYLGTSNGVYVADWKTHYNPFDDNRFRLIEQTRGQVWGMEIVDNELMVGHNDGTFVVDGFESNHISKIPGSWTFLNLKNHPNQMIEGKYYGLNLYEKVNGKWSFTKPIDNMIDESCRIMAEGNEGEIWVSHPYRGVYKIELDPSNKSVKSIKLYNSENGFPSDLYINVFKIGDGVIFTAEQGVYEYNNNKDIFELSENWSKYIDTTSRVQKLFEDKKGNIWFVIDGEVGVFWVDDMGVNKELRKELIPKLKGKLVGGFEHIYPYDNQNIFFALENGFMHFNPTLYETQDTLLFTNISTVKLGDTTEVFGGWPSENWKVPTFQPFESSFTFSYAATSFSDFLNIEFQYILEGVDEKWSLWTTKTIKEYTNLKPGKYNFKVKARDIRNKETNISSFEFEISPPWYATTTARSIYAILVIGLLLGIILVPRRKFEQEKAILKIEQEKTLEAKEKEYQEVVQENEAEIVRLREEKLQAQIMFKNQELATTTMHLVQKGEFLNKLKLELDELVKNTTDNTIKKDIRKVIRLLDKDARLDEDWQQFAQYFDNVHEDFLKRLKEQFPHLSAKDLRLATYLRMNLSTKEIAPLLNISIRGVEISRYRLRKKLDLPTEINLNDFMIGL